jgi:hypothetical protein
MVAKNVCYILLLHVFIINGMENAEKQGNTSLTTYDTFTPRNIRETFSPRDSEVTSVPSLHNSINSPRDAVDLSLDLDDGPQQEIKELDDKEVNFFIRACEFTKSHGVSERRAAAVIKKNVNEPIIQKIISNMRQQKINPDEVQINHEDRKVRSPGVDLGVDMGEIYELSHKISRAAWKKDRTCCGHTVSKETGQKVTTGVLFALGTSGLLVCNALLYVYLGHEGTVNNYYYNCTNGTNPYLG